MTVAAEKILSEALRLPPEVRAFVAERLLESLDAAPGPELSPAWRAEIRRRLEELDAGTTELRDASDVFERAYRSLE
jgi:putative addiction module component (TIGR02574 family)